MAKVRVTLTAVAEYDVEPSYYYNEDDSIMTEAEAIECDREGVLEDPFSFIDSPKCKLDVKVERI